nr:MAG TPA: hypothetical protein [Caudoviricetes sp.]
MCHLCIIPIFSSVGYRFGRLRTYTILFYFPISI